MTVSISPKTQYAWNKSFQFTNLSFFGFLGGRNMTSVSGFSYASTVAAAQSVKQQMTIMRNELSICGSPKMTFVMMGQSSEKVPAGRR